MFSADSCSGVSHLDSTSISCCAVEDGGMGVSLLPCCCVALPHGQYLGEKQGTLCPGKVMGYGSKVIGYGKKTGEQVTVGW